MGSGVDSAKREKMFRKQDIYTPAMKKLVNKKIKEFNYLRGTSSKAAASKMSIMGILSDQITEMFIKERYRIQDDEDAEETEEKVILSSHLNLTGFSFSSHRRCKFLTSNEIA